MSTNLVNTFNPSQLVSQDILKLLGEFKSTVLECTSQAEMSGFNNEKYAPGKTIGYQVSGVPVLNRGERLKFNSYEQRTLYITADVERWYFSHSVPFDQTDKLFYTNPKILTETLTAPTIRAFKDQIELEGAQYAIEHAPIFPSFTDDITQEFTLDETKNFRANVTNYLNQLRKDLELPGGYKLILNNRDDRLFSDSLMGVFNPDYVRGAVSDGEAPRMISGFPSRSTPRLGRHDVDASSQSLTTGLTFDVLPSSDEYPLAVIRNNTGAPVILKAGDIIYYTNKNSAATGAYWIKQTVKEPSTARYSFCVTSDKYIKDKVAGSGLPANFKYSDVTYTIPANSTLEVSLSHKPIFSGMHQNCSREIATGASGDQFFVLPSHYKNLGLHKNYFKFKCFKLQDLYGTEQSRISDGKTGIQMLVTRDRILGEGMRRGNLMDIAALPCFGAVSQNLFTLPVHPDATSQESVSAVVHSSAPKTVSMSAVKKSGK